MNKICSLCKDKAAWGVIDKFGWMEPGTLCPKHYTIWRNSPWGWCLIFHLLTDGKMVSKKYAKERLVRVQTEEANLKKLMRAETIAHVTTMDEAKEQSVMDALDATGFNIMRASRMLNISKATMYRLIKRYGIRIIRQIDPKGGFK